MDRYRAIIVEDEPFARVRIKKLLSDFPEIDIIGEASDGVEGVELVKSLEPDLIFLDIEMPELSGFEMIKMLEIQPFIIFTTAYNQYALDAFDTYAIDYLTKPIDIKDLKRSIDRLQQYRKGSDLSSRVNSLIDDLGDVGGGKVEIRIDDEVRYLDSSDIIYIQSDDKRSKIYTREDCFSSNFSLSKYDKILNGSFIRIHRSYIINRDHVKQIIKWYRDQHKLVMNDRSSTEIPINKESNRKLDTLFDLSL
jgi:two-component system LytT family response regulator